MKFLILTLALLVPALALAQQGGDFQPLTSLPAFREIENANSLSAFFNSLYKICIGVAAVLAVVQIIRSGITYMLADTGFVEKREAKGAIMRAIFGLLLVLSPAIVFGIIDPRILELELNFGELGTQKSLSEESKEFENTQDDDRDPSSDTHPYVYAINPNRYLLIAGALQDRDADCYAMIEQKAYPTNEQTACQTRLQEIQNGNTPDTRIFKACEYHAGGELIVNMDAPQCP